MIVSFAAAAEIDLEKIGDYISRDNPMQAVTFVREIRQHCLRLADFPRVLHDAAERC